MGLNVGLIQSDIEWENTGGNLRRFEKHLESLSTDTDIAVLPEMFSTGFSMRADEVSIDLNHEVVQWLKEQSLKHNIAIIAGAATTQHIDGKEGHYNSLLWSEPSKEILIYNKKHLFALAGEGKFYERGNKKVIIEYKGWRICPLICYDLRFPVWSRNVKFNNEGTPDYEYDCAIYIANWPEARNLQWSALLKARAIENQACVVGVNRIGSDAKGFTYSGDSVAISQLGKELSSIKPHEEQCENIIFDKEALDKYRLKFPFVADADRFDIY